MRSGQRFVDAECKRFGLYQRPEEVSRSGHCGAAHLGPERRLQPLRCAQHGRLEVGSSLRDRGNVAGFPLAEVPFV